MARIKIELPENFQFTTEIPIRITDLNYGGHVGNDRILGLLHEARVLFLTHYGFTELDVSGSSLIMSDVAIEFKRELHYGDRLIVSVAISNFTRAAFELYYKIEVLTEDKKMVAVSAKTGMVCYDYTSSKVCSVPQEFKSVFE